MRFEGFSLPHFGSLQMVKLDEELQSYLFDFATWDTWQNETIHLSVQLVSFLKEN